MELSISDYIIYHIKKHWKKLLNELYLDVFNNKLKAKSNQSSSGDIFIYINHQGF